MTHEQFCYWLQGFSEVTGRAPTEAEWQVIQDHLKTAFVKIAPVYPPSQLNPQWAVLNPTVAIC